VAKEQVQDPGQTAIVTIGQFFEKIRGSASLAALDRAASLVR